MAGELERLADELFPSVAGGCHVLNVKISRGRNRLVTADQLAEQILHANIEIAAGRAVLLENIDGNPRRDSAA